MSKSKKKKAQKRKVQDDPITHSAITDVKVPRLGRAKKKKVKMSSQATSSSHSSVPSKDALPVTANTASSADAVKAQCDLCKLSYSCKAKLTEHLVSLMHHTRLDDAEKTPDHDCVLCNQTFTDMPSYREHIGTNKHLKKLEALRGLDKGKQERNKDKKQHNRNENESALLEFRTQQPSYNNFINNSNNWNGPGYHPAQNYGNYGPGYHPAQNYGNDQNWGHRNSYFNPSNQNFNKFQQQNYYRGAPNDWNYSRGHQSWSSVHRDNTDYSQRNERMDFLKQKNAGKKDIPWGSGARGHENRWSHGFYEKQDSHRNNYHGNDDRVEGYWQDNFDSCWDEQSFRQHEDFLADMDQECPPNLEERRPWVSANQYDRRHNNYEPNSEHYKRGRWDASSFNDRKRPRSEDHAVDSTAKSSKPLNQEGKEGNTYKKDSRSDDSNRGDVNSSFSFQNQNSASNNLEYNNAKSQEKSSLDNASDSILERAERLCKELREKREASNVQKNNLLKSQTHHVLNDKMNHLKKSQQGYIKGHIKNSPKDQTSSRDSAIYSVSVSSAASHTSEMPSPRNSVSSVSSSKVKTLDEIRKSIEQSVLEDTQVNVPVSHSKTHSRTRTRSLCETSSASDSHVPLKGKTQSLIENEGRHGKSPAKHDSSVNLSGKIASKSGPKPPITKEHLNKMVNCPRSRTERVQLARMFHSREDNRSSAHIPPRAINLEGLYDSSTANDIQLDIGGDMATIKLEELSEDIRSQILGLIQDDIGSVSDEMGKETHILDEEANKKGKKTKSAVTENNSGERKEKDGRHHGKIPKRNKSTASDVVDTRSLSPNRDVIQASDLLSLSKIEKARETVSKFDGMKGLSKSAVATANAAGAKESFSALPHTIDASNQLYSSKHASSDHEKSSHLTSENIMSKYPTLMSPLGTSFDQKKSAVVEDGKNKSSLDSGRSSMSLPASVSSSLATSVSLKSSLDSGRSSLLLPSSVSSSLPTSVSLKSSLDSGRSSLLSPSSVSSPLPTSVSLTSSHLSSSSVDMQSSDAILNSVASSSKPATEKDVPSLPDYLLVDELNGSSMRSERSIDPIERRTPIVSSLATLGESSSTMSELLTLSEQEECVKQEMMSMELRLTRLHRLLEQAVNQINKCTERRNELQEEEKGLTNRRIALLREATSSSQQDIRTVVPETSQDVSRPSTLTTTSTSVTTTSQPHSLSSGPPDRLKAVSSSTTSTNRLVSQTSGPGLPSSSHPDSLNIDNPTPAEPSLSRSEWLAKFSAYLPSDLVSSKDPTSEKTSSIALSSNAVKTSSTKSPSSFDLPSRQSMRERDLGRKDPSTDSRQSLVSDSSRHREPFVSGKEDSVSVHSESLSHASNAMSISQEFTSPIMYVGSFKSGDNQTNKSKAPTPVMVINSATISSLFKDPGDRDVLNSVNPVNILGPGSQLEPTKENSFPSGSRRGSIGSPRQEDSDIGSIASVASGSSLGEHISRYCRFTPGASADGHNPHELSVILSGPSDTSELKDLEDERGINHDHEGLDSTNRNEMLGKLKEDAGNSRLYGRLDQESVKSAEALHLLERNNDVPATPAWDKEERKKKKRRTKNQRDSNTRVRPKPYVISSSSTESADENCDKTNGKGDANVVSSLEKRLRKSPDSTSDDDSDLYSLGPAAFSKSGKLKLDGVEGKSIDSCSSPSKRNRGAEVTVAECDSSTSLGMVDADGLNKQSNVLKEIAMLKEMSDSFKKSFGREPKYLKGREADSKVSSPESNRNAVVVISDSDDTKGREGGVSNSNVIDLCDDEAVEESSLTRQSGGLSSSRSSFEKTCRYPGEEGPVCHLHYQDDKIYVGILRFGFKVLPCSSDENQFILPNLACMAVGKVSGDVKVFVGSGHSLVMVQPSNLRKREVDLGTTVLCVHVINHTIFAGLDTGEICVRDIQSWKEINRYICSDSPIHCIASGSEGGTRLLCVASQDSTIIVVDADRCLPLRILVGLSEMALSVQVHDQYVISGSRDGSVFLHNLHTARVEKEYKDDKGLVTSVYYSNGYLFTGGMDGLVRCYNAKTHKLVQVYYGADMGVILALYVVEDKILVTGNSLGSVDAVTLDLKAKHPCKNKSCRLNFGLATHLAWHVQRDHS